MARNIPNNTREKIRIIPIMIVVALMAFSVRLVDFASGVSSLSGSAMAAGGKEPEAAPEGTKPPGDEALNKAGEIPKPEEKTVKEDLKAEVNADEPAKLAEKPKEGKKDVDLPGVKWRDASDEEEDDPASADKKQVLDDLTKRREGLDKRDNEIKTREALLKVTEQELDRKYQELSQLRTEIMSLLDKQTEEEKARIGSLVKIYEGMKPAEAARIFDTLDLDVLMSVMSKMSERKLSPILAAMTPERAKTITVMLAQEKKLPSLPEGN